MPNIYLTDTFVFSASCPAGKDQELFWDHPLGHDGKVRNGSVSGLGLRVTALGNKSFVHAYQFNGKRCRKVLGSTVALDVGSARLSVIQRQRQLEAGENPDYDDADRTHLMTVHEAIDRYWQSHMVEMSPVYREAFTMVVARWLKPPRTTTTRRGFHIRRAYVDFGTMFSDRPILSIKPLDIEKYVRQFTSPYSYNRGLHQVSIMFNWLNRMQLIDMRNPCGPIRAQKIIRRRRNYSTEQIRQIAAHIFYPILKAVPDTDDLSGLDKRDVALTKAHAVTANDQMQELCNYMGILFLTMARPSDLTNARFDHFDLEKLVWHKHNTKGIKLSRAIYEYAYRSVPIHPKVGAIVRAQRLRWPESDLLFPSHRDPTKPRDNFRRGLDRFKTLDGVPDYFQLYDLKRIAISLMLTGQGVSHEAVSHYVDHKGNLATTAIYDLGLVDPMRPVTEKLGTLLGL